MNTVTEKPFLFSGESAIGKEVKSNKRPASASLFFADTFQSPLRKKVRLSENEPLPPLLLRIQSAISFHFTLTDEISAMSFHQQINQIEFLSEQFENIEIEESVKEKINLIFYHKEWNQAQKMAELGLLYFYLTRDGFFPECCSLLEYRFSEMKEQINELQDHHKKHCPNNFLNLIPSGINHYILRAFVRMIFTPTAIFNEGGCYAVKALLKSPIGLELGQEHCSQVLSVIDRLLSDLSFRYKLIDPFEIHPIFSDLIRIDLKLFYDENISFLHVRWSLMLSLFSMMCQIKSHKNCFSVAVTANILRQFQDYALDLLIEVLTKGTFSFENVEIPIDPILESLQACEFENEFNSKIIESEAVSLIGFYLAEERLGIKGSSPKEMPTTLQEAMEKVFGEKISLAKRIYLSLKCNFLQQTLLGVIQFKCINSNEIVGEIFSDKKKFLDSIFVCLINEILSGNFQYSNSDFNQLKEKFLNSLVKQFWFFDYTSTPIINNKLINFDFHLKGLKVSSLEFDVKELKYLRRLFFLKDGKLSPLDRITDFTSMICRFIDEECPEVTIISQNAKILKDYLASDPLKRKISEFLSIENQLEIKQMNDWRSYYESDFFLKLQDGGNPRNFISLPPLDKYFHSIGKIAYESPQDFFLQLCKCLRRCNEKKPNLFSNPDHDAFVLIDCSSHIFNLTPARSSSFWCLADPFLKLKELILTPGQNLEKKSLSTEMKSQMLSEVHDFCPLYLIGKYSRISRLSIFVQRISNSIPKNLKNIFYDSVNASLTIISYEEVQSSLVLILKQLNFYCSPSQLNSILITISKKHNQSSFSTLELAWYLQEGLVENGLPYFLLHQLENAICTVFHFPWVIDLGSLNWTDGSEKIQSDRLVLKYDFIEGKIKWYCRRGIVEYRFQNDFENELKNEEIEIFVSFDFNTADSLGEPEKENFHGIN